MQLGQIDGIFVGHPATLVAGKPPSAIVKTAVTGPVWVARTGLAGDLQADLTVHGGVWKAVHAYPARHLPVWNAELGLNLTPGFLGENLSVSGMDEGDLCIGDVLAAGGAMLAVTQGREPCWKLNARVGREDFAFHVRKTGRSGWYFAVTQPGFIAAGDGLHLEERPNPGATVRAVTAALNNPRLDPGLAATLSHLPGLFPGWAAAFAERALP
jgi:MOSC domain-containing protein YiiM